ncbi:hypothetical protein Micbo1qcDRAFT_15887 [Microdochium bolleyi]|uniref:C2H2-type domain-containing protein n=1 Tax=Microdochium bolleyi TaxID=196109 RepID=A0A136IV59_9PEZI|nr:hypothetical protein Micbo1qcDRAFT_15887 [Microdochium bolleyi]
MNVMETDDGAPDNGGELKSLAVQFSTVLQTFHQTLSSLTSVLRETSVFQDRTSNLEKLLDSYNRLKIWGLETRAWMPPTHHGSTMSLDHILDTDPALKSNILETLEELCSLVETYHRLSFEAARAPQEYDYDDHISESSINSAEGVSAADDDHDDQLYHERQYSSALLQITECIEDLYSFSRLIQKPNTIKRYLRSSNSEEGSSNIDSNIWDEAHIRQKLEAWNTTERKLTSTEANLIPSNTRKRKRTSTTISDTGRPAKDELPVTQEEMQQRSKQLGPGTRLNTLVRRLANGNVQRRKQFAYWDEHPSWVKDMNLDLRELARKQVDWPPTSGSQPSHQDRHTEGLGAAINNSSGSQRTLETRHTFSTTRQSTVGRELGLSSRHISSATVYAETTIQDQLRTPLPPVPKKIAPDDLVCPDCHKERSSEVRDSDCPSCLAVQNATFKCPYCYQDLPTLFMQERNNWKRHVYRDLRPYMCTSSNCKTPSKMFSTRHEWTYHEIQMHRHVWACQWCRETAASEDEMAHHLQSKHDDVLSADISAQRLALTLNACERQIDAESIQTCPLCPMVLRFSRLMDHIAEHLEEISLFALPSQAPVEGDGDGEKKVAIETDYPIQHRENIACPFPKHNPARYVHVRESCTTGWGFSDTGKLNEHIRRIHSRVFGCLRCGHRFTNISKPKLAEAKAAHRCYKLVMEACEFQPDPRFGTEWMTEEQEERYSNLNFSRGNSSEGPRVVFRRIYSALWPDTVEAHIPSHLHMPGYFLDPTDMERQRRELQEREQEKDLEIARLKEQLRLLGGSLPEDS